MPNAILIADLEETSTRDPLQPAGVNEGTWWLRGYARAYRELEPLPPQREPAREAYEAGFEIGASNRERDALHHQRSGPASRQHLGVKLNARHEPHEASSSGPAPGPREEDLDPAAPAHPGPLKQERVQQQQRFA
jgi:hypothetical protein